MTLTSKPVREAKVVIVKDSERCEATSFVSHVLTHRCTARGEMYSVAAGLARGFARLCTRHVSTFTKAGFTVEPITPLDNQARNAVAL